jgi:predicted TIM-barrel fold metal-dependent hydrolase
MHRLGVRGVRLNLKTEGKSPDRDRFRDILHLYARRLRPRRWVLQIYISLPQFRLIADEITKLGGGSSSSSSTMPVVIDHLGHPDPSIPITQQEGYAELMDALLRREIWMKLSGTYRFAALPGLDTFAREVIRIAPTQVVWASDWPHTGSVENNPNGDRTIHQDYRRVDDIGFVKQCIAWCDGDEDLMRRIWVDNPRRLWQYDEKEVVDVQQKL